jgi:hypothetical protein
VELRQMDFRVLHALMKLQDLGGVGIRAGLKRCI